MRRIQGEDVTSLSFPSNQIWKAITDFDSYPKWWPSSVTIDVRRINPELVGSQFVVRPYGGRSFVCEVESFEEKKEMRLQYSGIYKGIGAWRISEDGQRCRVSYRIDLEITDGLVNLLACIIPVRRLHSRLMQQIFRGLEQYIAKSPMN